jgi:hypothetical protein
MSFSISKEELMRIVREELDSVMSEVALCHDPKTGHFADCKPGNVYSLTKKAAEENNIDNSYVQRGTVTKKKKRSPPKVRAKFGLNSSEKLSGGRKTISGKDIPPKYMVSRYKEKYSEAKGQKFNPDWPSAKERKRQSSIGRPSNRSWHHGYEEMDKLARGVGLGVLEEVFFSYSQLEEIVSQAFPDDVVDESRMAQAQACRKIGYITMGEAQKKILGALNSFAKAREGDLHDAGK